MCWTLERLLMEPNIRAETCLLFRLFSYDPVTKKTELLVTDMYATNGIQLSPNEDFLLVTESIRCNVRRYVG